MHKIPSDEEIREAVALALAKNITIDSQKRLKQLVQKELEKMNKKYKASASRIRRLTVKSGLAKIDIDYRETDRKGAMNRCPVCGEKIKLVKNKTIFNGVVTTGYKCSNCPYWTGLRRQVPTRYIFHKRA